MLSTRRRCLVYERRLAKKSSLPPAPAGVYYDQAGKQMQAYTADYERHKNSRTAASTPMRFAGEIKSLHSPAAPPFTAGYGRQRPAPPPPPHHGGPAAYLHGRLPPSHRGLPMYCGLPAYLHGRSLSSNAAGVSLLYHAVDSGGSGGMESRYVEHIYESPTCVRKDMEDGQDAGESLQYFEIDVERQRVAGGGTAANAQEASLSAVAQWH